MPNMTLIKKLPPAKYLRECFDYNPRTGVLRWRARPRVHFQTEHGWKISNSRFTGTVAGTVMPTDHYVVRINDIQYFLHRVIWKLVTGNDPLDTIDHADRNPKNNCWNNLRQATHAEQMRNTKSRKSISGVRGVYPNGKNWTVVFSFNKTKYYLGTYPTTEEAGAIYRAFHRDFKYGNK